MNFISWFYLISWWMISIFASILAVYDVMETCEEVLSGITHEKSTPCKFPRSSPYKEFESSFNVALKTLKIFKVDNTTSIVQITLAASLSTLQEHEGSFLLTLFWGHSDACHRFIVPFSFLSSVQETFALPCIKIPLQTPLSQTFYMNTYYKETEENHYKHIHAQAAKYILKGTSKLQVLQSGFMNFQLFLDKNNFYLTSRFEGEEVCTSSYNISITESVANGVDLCDSHGQEIICGWFSDSKNSPVSLNCSKKRFKPSQTYCIHAYVSEPEECENLYPVETFQISFFKISPALFNKGMISKLFCKDWNNSFEIITHEQKMKGKKGISVEFNSVKEFDSCFQSYQFHLYTARPYTDCGAGYYDKPLHTKTINHTQQTVIVDFEDILGGNFCVLITPCDMEECRSRWSWRSKNIAIKVFPDLVSQPFCQMWNGTITTRSDEPKMTNKKLQKVLTVQFNPDYEYDSCFQYYRFRLYRAWPNIDCGAGEKNPLIQNDISHKQQTVLVDFVDIPKGNFCVLIIPCDIEKCHHRWSRRSTRNIAIEENHNVTIESDSREFPLHVKIAMILIPLVISLSIVLCLIKRFRRKKQTSYNSLFQAVQMLQTNEPNIEVRVFHTFDSSTKNYAENFVKTIKENLPSNTQRIENVPLESFQRIIKENLPFNIQIKTFSIDEACASLFLASSLRSLIPINSRIMPLDYYSLNWFTQHMCECLQGKRPTCNSSYKFIYVVSERLIEIMNGPHLKMNDEETFYRRVLEEIERRYSLENDRLHTYRVIFGKNDGRTELQNKLTHIGPRCFWVSNSVEFEEFCKDLKKTENELTESAV